MTSPPATTASLVQRGLEHHRAGRLTEAEALYRQALAIAPSDFDALHLLSMIARESGRYDEARDLINQALDVRPDSADALFALGIVLAASGRSEEAIAAYQRAIQVQPRLMPARNNLGNLFRAMGRLNKAIHTFVAAIQVDPTFVDPYNGLAGTLIDKDLIDDAITVCRDGIAKDPNFGLLHVTLAGALTHKGQIEEAIDVARTGVRLRPDLAEAHFTLGFALRRKELWTDAVAEYRKALELKEPFPEAHNNLAIALGTQGEYDGAIAHTRRAIELRPSYPEAHHILALHLLLYGRLKEGWVEHQWRWQVKQLRLKVADFTEPRWDGRDLTGKTLLIHSEQGYGDSIQFIRYLPMVLARGARVIMHCRPQLLRLFERLPGISLLSDQLEQLRGFDMHCSLMDLPAIFETEPATIPAKVPYLSADRAAVEQWEQKLSATAPRGKLLRVGLVWAGSPQHPNDRARSIPLSVLRGLARVPNVRFYSVQVGPAPSQPGDAPELAMVDHTAELRDFGETAAMLSALDLVIAPDTAIVHLAGALARPVWTMLPFVPDWRWLLGRSDSPWYPTLRLFRQPTAGDWESVVRAVASALEENVSTKAAAGESGPSS
jgi:tetratricopeptide (TPR) repeat protein